MLNGDKKRRTGMDGGEKLGRHLPFLNNEATEEEHQKYIIYKKKSFKFQVQNVPGLAPVWTFRESLFLTQTCCQ
jgi:hypothetical protein